MLISPQRPYVRINQILEAGSWVKVKCAKQGGAALLVKERAYRSDALSRKPFVEVIVRNHESWLTFANDVLGRGISLRDIVLVSGCDLTKEWTIATFDEETVNIDVSFSVNALPGSAGCGVWGEWQSELHVPNRSGPGPLLPPLSPSSTMIEQSRSPPSQADFNQCIFIRGYRIFRRLLPFALKLKAAAEPEDPSGDFEPSSSFMAMCEDGFTGHVDALERFPRSLEHFVRRLKSVSCHF